MARKLPKDALLTEILQKVSSAKTKKEKSRFTYKSIIIKDYVLS